MYRRAGHTVAVLLGASVLLALLGPSAAADHAPAGDRGSRGPSCVHLQAALQEAPNLAHYPDVVAQASRCGLSVSKTSSPPLCTHLAAAVALAPGLLRYPGVRGRVAACALAGGSGSGAQPASTGSGPSGSAGTPGGFGDLRGYSWAAGSINLLARMGIFKGVSAHRFDPQGHLTHAQFAALMTRLFHLPAPAAPLAFVDVPTTLWAYSDIQAAAPYMSQFHLPSGLAFEPSLDETRIEVAATIGEIEVAEGQAQLPSAAVAQSSWAKFSDGGLVPPGLAQAAAVALLQGVMKGYPNGSFGVDGPVTRAEAAVLLARILSASETMGGTPPPLGGTGSGGGSCGTVSGSVYCVTPSMP